MTEREREATDAGLRTGEVEARPRRRPGDALLRIATVALGASLPAGVLGAALCALTLLLGEGGRPEDLPFVFVGFAGVALAGAALLLALEEVALASGRPGVVVASTTIALAAAGLVVTGLAADGSDRHVIAATIVLVAGPVTALGLARTGGFPGSGGAPMLGRWQVLVFVVLAALETGLMAGPLRDALDLPRDEGTAALLVPLVLVGALLVGALPCLFVGDALAARWGLDPRPEPAGGLLARGLGCLLVTALLVGVVAVLVATRGLQVALDAWRPRLVVVSPLDPARVEEPWVVVRGRVEDASAVTLTLTRGPWSESPSSYAVTVGSDGEFEVEVPLEPGYNLLRLVAEDASRNRADLDLAVDCVAAAPDPWGGKGR